MTAVNAISVPNWVRRSVKWYLVILSSQAPQGSSAEAIICQCLQGTLLTKPCKKDVHLQGLAWNSKRCLGDIGGNNDEAMTLGSWPEDASLLSSWQRRIQRQDMHWGLLLSSGCCHRNALQHPSPGKGSSVWHSVRCLLTFSAPALHRKYLAETYPETQSVSRSSTSQQDNLMLRAIAGTDGDSSHPSTPHALKFRMPPFQPGPRFASLVAHDLIGCMAPKLGSAYRTEGAVTGRTSSFCQCASASCSC